MNIEVEISKVESVDAINIISFIVESHTLKMMSLELDSRLKVGSRVRVGTKSSNISLSKQLNADLSISNQLPCTITSIKIGELLCVVSLEFLGSALESLITKDSALRMKLKEGSEIVALVKASELSILEVL